METYIKYQRFVKELTAEEEIQPFLDELVKGGWEIISYTEEKKFKKNTTLSAGNSTTELNQLVEVINIIIVAGKKQSNIL